jgi:hypothetical protein
MKSQARIELEANEKVALLQVWNQVGGSEVLRSVFRLQRAGILEFHPRGEQNIGPNLYIRRTIQRGDQAETLREAQNTYENLNTEEKWWLMIAAHHGYQWLDQDSVDKINAQLEPHSRSISGRYLSTLAQRDILRSPFGARKYGVTEFGEIVNQILTERGIDRLITSLALD